MLALPFSFLYVIFQVWTIKKITFALKNKEKRFKNLVKDLPSSSKYTQFELLFWIQGLINYIKLFFNKGLKVSCGVTK